MTANIQKIACKWVRSDICIINLLLWEAEIVSALRNSTMFHRSHKLIDGMHYSDTLTVVFTEKWDVVQSNYPTCADSLCSQF